METGLLALYIPYADMDNLRVCVYIAEEHPETINYPVGEPNWNEVKKAKMGESYTVEVVKNKDDVNLNLNAFQRIPKNTDGVVLLHGEELFKHMVNFRNLRCSKNGKLEPSSYLHLEISMDQEKILNLAEQDLRRTLIFRDAMQSSNRKLATRKLNVIGNMVGHCSVLTSDEHLRRAREDCRLAAF